MSSKLNKTHFFIKLHGRHPRKLALRNDFVIHYIGTLSLKPALGQTVISKVTTDKTDSNLKFQFYRGSGSKKI